MSYLSKLAKVRIEQDEISAAATEGAQAAAKGGKSSVGRFRAVADDPRIAGNPGLRGLAMARAEREPAHTSADTIVAETIAAFGSPSVADGGASLRKAVAAREAAGAVDGIGYVPSEPDRAAKAKAGWEKVLDAAIAARFVG